MDKTIAAVATPRGTGAVAMIRVSGRDCFDVCDRVYYKNPEFSLKTAQKNTTHYGKIVKIASRETIDHVVLAVYRGPGSYTGEDVAEIFCHGGNVITERVLGEIIKAGARPAQPGEFSKRAFLNGKLDLSQAEAVISLINSKSEASGTVAAGQLEGRIGSGIKEIRSELIEALSHIMAYVDFPDEDVDYIDEDMVRGLIEDAVDKIRILISTYSSGRAITKGIDCAIIGRTNAGKSSLMNALTGDETSIVTEIAGTTRDIVSKSITAGTIILNLLDTAGLREAQGEVERIGIERAKRAAEAAELIILVADASDISTPDSELQDMLRGKKVIIAANKTDLPKRYDENLYAAFGTIVDVSAKTKEGIPELKSLIEKTLIDNKLDITHDKIITNTRHFDALCRGEESLSEALQGLDMGLTFDVVSIDIQNAAEALGEIVGLNVSDEVIGRIFEKFCIGK